MEINTKNTKILKSSQLRIYVQKNTKKYNTYIQNRDTYTLKYYKISHLFKLTKRFYLVSVLYFLIAIKCQI